MITAYISHVYWPMSCVKDGIPGAAYGNVIRPRHFSGTSMRRASNPDFDAFSLTFRSCCSLEGSPFNRIQIESVSRMGGRCFRSLVEHKSRGACL